MGKFQALGAFKPTLADVAPVSLRHQVAYLKQSDNVFLWRRFKAGPSFSFCQLARFMCKPKDDSRGRETGIGFA